MLEAKWVKASFHSNAWLKDFPLSHKSKTSISSTYSVWLSLGPEWLGHAWHRHAGENHIPQSWGQLQPSPLCLEVGVGLPVSQGCSFYGSLLKVTYAFTHPVNKIKVNLYVYQPGLFLRSVGRGARLRGQDSLNVGYP